MPFPLFPLVTSDFSHEPLSRLEIKEASPFNFAPEENNGLKLHYGPKLLLFPLSCLKIARRTGITFLGQPTIFRVTVSVMAAAAVSLGEGRREEKRREERRRRKMFLPVKIYRITTKVELAPLFTVGEAVRSTDAWNLLLLSSVKVSKRAN